MPRRHHEVTRLEGFSDTVFGFALTLLVVSLEVPNDVDGLLNQMKGFFGFALMFAMVIWIWYEHNWFFRRTGLQDPWTVFLNSALLFVVLFYVYPLKFLTAGLLYAFFGIGPENSPRMLSASDGGPMVLALYSLGVVLIFGTFVLLYRHAMATGLELDLPATDRLQFRFARRSHVISMSIGLASLCLAVVAMSVPGTGYVAFIAGVLYFLMGPLHGWNGYQLGKALSEIEPRPPAQTS